MKRQDPFTLPSPPLGERAGGEERINKAMFSTIVVIFYFAACALIPSPARADEEEVLKKIEELEALRAKDPAAYQASIEERKGRLHRKFNEFHAKHPERFRDFSERRREFGERHFKHWRERHPEAYERLRQKQKRDRPGPPFVREGFPHRPASRTEQAVRFPSWERPARRGGQHPERGRRRER